MEKTSTPPLTQPKSVLKKIRKRKAQTEEHFTLPSDSVINWLLSYSKALQVIPTNSTGYVNNLLN